MKSTSVFIFLIISSILLTAQDFSKGKWIDLTHEFDENTIYWPTAETFKHETVFEGMTDKEYYYSSYKYSAEEHGGTHLDAPIHFAQGKNSVELIPVNQLIGYSAVINVTEKTINNPDYQVTVEDIKNWEKKNGELPDNAIVLLYTGFGKFWQDRIKYMGTDKRGKEGVVELHFPGLHPDAAKWLVKERKINALGLDTPSIDFGQSEYFETHRILFANNIAAFENVANLDKLPEKGTYIIALPMKIKGGSGAPLRIIAHIQ